MRLYVQASRESESRYRAYNEADPGEGPLNMKQLA